MLKNENGFSLVQVMVASALMGGLALAFMQLVKNMDQAQNFADSKSDELELKSSIRMLLNNEKYCRVSLAGNGPSGSPSGPVTFYKTSIDEDNEGLDIALYFSNQDGDMRTLKKFNGENNPGTDDQSKHGKLKIRTMKLIMNNGTGSNYSNSLAHNDIGIIRAVVEKKISQTQTREFVLDFDIDIALSTGQSPESSGQSRIISCRREFAENQKYSYPQNCSITFSHSDNGGPYRSAVLDMDSGGLIGVRLRGDVNSDDRFQMRATCGAGNEITSYLSNCTLGFGWKDSTDSSNPAHAYPNPTRAYDASFGSTITLQTGGDVNADDSFYFRLRCPIGAGPELNSYMKSKCSICMGHADRWYSSPEKSSCKKIQDTSDDTWGRIMTSGDVGADDALFLGFFCEGEYSPIIKAWSY